MKAMILAAGIGSRLRPLTDTRPKALIEINGVTLLERTISGLKSFGIGEIIINVHHFPELITGFLKQKNYFDIRIEISAEPRLLDTGGGLRRAGWFFDDDQPFLLHNVDVLTNLDYRELYDELARKSALAVLAVRQRDTSRYFLFDGQNRLGGWQNVQNNEKIIACAEDKPLIPLSFMGIQVLSPEIFNHMPRQSRFSMVDVYLQAAKAGQPVYGLDCGAYNWLDVGKPESLKKAQDFIGY
ncbi:MAG: nucleotidyltransferase family protein [Calditrichaceae bacterium]|nr:nucleotidyltransferase family protein [Calditrichaceae bacterium]MBN2709054.1 nucleotidyltransferase family protein [Calditrichaceae bacterium]RQV97012.1 MAG: nucleotidyltransferase family protein [Calditrichota bacterium]